MELCKSEGTPGPAAEGEPQGAVPPAPQRSTVAAAEPARPSQPFLCRNGFLFASLLCFGSVGFFFFPQGKQATISKRASATRHGGGTRVGSLPGPGSSSSRRKAARTRSPSTPRHLASGLGAGIRSRAERSLRPNPQSRSRARTCPAPRSGERTAQPSWPGSVQQDGSPSGCPPDG